MAFCRGGGHFRFACRENNQTGSSRRGKNTKKILFNARKALTADGRRAMIFSSQKVRGAASAAETVKAEPL